MQAPKKVSLLLALYILAALGLALPILKQDACPTPELGNFCVVVRTYWGHGRASKTGLRELLSSLRRQSVSNWEALLVVMDSKPFPDLAHIVNEFHDDRIWVYAEWVGKQFAPRSEEGYWSPAYHTVLYDLTDEAIRACSPQTRWVIVTNGDNEYASTAFAEVLEQGSHDVVAFDFYSRYQRITGPRCERFSALPGLPPCKVNMMRWCHTDLGANALNWPRMIQEDRRFGTLPPSILGSDSFDGVMAQTLVEAGWTVHHKTNSCSFEHDPSPQRCAKVGGVWDDTFRRALNSPGGDCISMAEAHEKMAQGGVEEILIDLSNDGRLADFQAPGDQLITQIRCLRDSDPNPALEYAAGFFGTACAAEFDISQ